MSIINRIADAAAAAAVAGNEVLAKLRRQVAAAEYVNRVDAVPYAGATITSSVTEDGALTNYNTPAGGKIRLRNVISEGDGWGVSVVTDLDPLTTQTQISACEFITTGAKVSIKANYLGPAKAAYVWVDGRYAGTVAGANASGVGYVFIEFASSAARRIFVRFSFPPWSLEVAVAPGDVVMQPQEGIRGVLIGDSVDQGFNAVNQTAGHAFVLGDLLGIDLVASATAGSGVLATGAGLAYPTRFAYDVGTAEWDIVMVKASENDTPHGSASEIAAALIAFLRTVRSRYPSTPIVLIGYSPGLGLAAYETALGAAFGVWGDANSLYIPTASWWTSAAQITALGNHHPNDLGHMLRARLEAKAIRAWLA